jgi:hypothetical protein
MTPGQRYLTRSGAVVEIIERRDTGLTKCDRMGVKSRAYLLIVQIVTCADGTPAVTDAPRQYALHDDGNYCGQDHALDLVQRVMERAA